MHGAYDDLISPGKQELHRRISNSYLMISPFLTHTHLADNSCLRRSESGAGNRSSLYIFQSDPVIENFSDNAEFTGRRLSTNAAYFC